MSKTKAWLMDLEEKAMISEKDIKDYKDMGFKQPLSLDAAYERRAIDQGLVRNPVFPENVLYLKMLQHNTGKPEDAFE